MGDLQTFMEILMFEIIFIALLVSYGQYNSTINCQAFWESSPGTVNTVCYTDPATNMTTCSGSGDIWAWLSIFNPQCSGFPLIVWILTVVIPIITIIAYFVPFK